MTGEYVNNQTPEGNDHPSAQRVAAWLSGGVAAEERLDLEQHFIRCAECRAQMAMIRQARQPERELQQSPEFANLLQLGEQAAQQAWQQRRTFAEVTPTAPSRDSEMRAEWWRFWQRAHAGESPPAGFFGTRGALALAAMLLLSFGLMSLLAWQLWQERREKEQARQLAAQYDDSRKELAQRLSQLEQAGGEQLKQEREKRVEAETRAEQLKVQLNTSQAGQQNIPVYDRHLSAEKGTSDELSLGIPASTQAFTLRLFKRNPYDFPEYVLEILNQRGQKVSELTGLRPVGEDGTLNLALNRTSFEAGKYQLRLFGQRGRVRQRIGQYELSLNYVR
jgi:hypothetical protein